MAAKYKNIKTQIKLRLKKLSRETQTIQTKHYNTKKNTQSN